MNGERPWRRRCNAHARGRSAKQEQKISLTLVHYCSSVPSVSAEDEVEEAHLVASADRAAGWRESRRWCGVDHGSALLQRRRAPQQPGQGHGRSSARFSGRGIWTHVPAELGRFKLFASDKDGWIATTCRYPPVQSARSCDVGDGRNRYMRPVRLSGIARLKKVPTRAPRESFRRKRGLLCLKGP